MRRTVGRLAMVGFAAAAVLIAGATAAQAKPGHRVGFDIRPANTSGSVDLGKRGDYRIGLSMPTDRVAIFYVSGSKVKGDRGGFFSNAYAVHNRRSLTRGAIRARLGSLGTISLRFRPNGRVRKRRPQQGCEGRPSITEYGRFVGRATFHGESGYLHFSLPGGAGDITRSFRLSCEEDEPFDLTRGSLRAYVAPGSFFATRGDIALLYATTHNHGRYVGITAGHQEESPPGAVVRIGILESKEAMAIGRYSFVLGPPGTLRTSLPGVHPANATLAPPAPFFGKATYREEPADARSWTGTLGINLLGLKLPLVGSRFHTRLCVLNPLKTRDGCDFFKAEPPLYGRPARLGTILR
ncbi:MAG TPA: hypothetical protein VHQ43_12370 [Solirubrobacterales bacterium]|nr:hypothetical protein [Solirubrobacterales bacterium]